MNNKHTPGPWRDGMDGNGNPIIFQRADDRYMRPEDINEEWQANLMLASAAPELLEALQELLPTLEDQRIDKRARAAIAKATGIDHD